MMMEQKDKLEKSNIEENFASFKESFENCLNEHEPKGSFKVEEVNQQNLPFWDSFVQYRQDKNGNSNDEVEMFVNYIEIHRLRVTKAAEANNT